MKKALVGFQGYVMQIEEPGNDFEIYNGPDAKMQWVDAPDEITLDWTLEYSPSQGISIWVPRDGAHTDNEVARRVAYGTVEEQLDMLFHEVQDNGTISRNGPWATHISTVKSSIPAPEARPEQLTPEEAMALDAIREPSADAAPKIGTEDNPAWKLCPTWRGGSQ